MLQEIQLDLLPQTFKDAIHITRELGYQYIWIDSLCILQDDQYDWAYESSTMIRIYSNSVLTIAALWGCNSDSGCFIERKPLQQQDCRIGDWAGSGIYVESVDRRLRNDFGQVDPAPLYKRAWVLQERLLSPRILCYGPLQLHWECFTHQFDEMSPKANPSTGCEGDLTKHDFKLFEQLRMPETEYIYQRPTSASIYGIWSNIKSQYWKSVLTFESDVLVAFSGITVSMEKTLGMKNLYGLWAEFLALEFLWAVLNPTKAVRSPEFPTWSWASVRGTDFYQQLGMRRYLDSNCQVQILVEEVPSLVWLPDNQTREPPRILRVHGPVISTVLKGRYRDFYSATQPSVRISVWPDCDFMPGNSEVYLLQVVLFDTKFEYPDTRIIVNRPSIGLVLLLVAAEPLTFQRVGTWENGWTSLHPRIQSHEILKFTKSETFLLV